MITKSRHTKMQHDYTSQSLRNLTTSRSLIHKIVFAFRSLQFISSANITLCLPLLQVTTVDRYQGQQNDYIILSLVRTKTVGHLRDVRRLVVAMSRARLGLYVLARVALFQNCFELSPAFSQVNLWPCLGFCCSPLIFPGPNGLRTEFLCVIFVIRNPENGNLIPSVFTTVRDGPSGGLWMTLKNKTNISCGTLKQQKSRCSISR